MIFFHNYNQLDKFQFVLQYCRGWRPRQPAGMQKQIGNTGRRRRRPLQFHSFRSIPVYRADQRVYYRSNRNKSQAAAGSLAFTVLQCIWGSLWLFNRFLQRLRIPFRLPNQLRFFFAYLLFSANCFDCFLFVKAR